MTEPEPQAVVMDLQETVILCVCKSWLPPRREGKPGFHGGDIGFLFIFKLGLKPLLQKYPEQLLSDACSRNGKSRV